MEEQKRAYSRYSKQVKLEAIRRVLEEDQPVHAVITDLGIRHRDNVYEWIKKYKKSGSAAFERSLMHTEGEAEQDSIQKQLENLKIEVEALKTYLERTIQGEEGKYKVIQTLEDQFPVDLLCHALDVSKARFLEYRHSQM
ncbi:transposase [Ornithinibacillus contaminans]|uniref:transposase n=1 Tax=Ornithinibacillus contaminans TaxID=694055 RepID=UPI00064D7447|nr:transposase [Ornithinibacillus contaminans]